MLFAHLDDALLQFVGRKTTPFRYNARYQIGRRYIEGWIPARNAGRCDTMFADMCHFAIRSLLDDDVITARNGQIDGGERCCNVEWHFVVARNAGNLISSDLVGGVAICGDLLPGVRPKIDCTLNGMVNDFYHP